MCTGVMWERISKLMLNNQTVEAHSFPSLSLPAIIFRSQTSELKSSHFLESPYSPPPPPPPLSLPPSSLTPTLPPYIPAGLKRVTLMKDPVKGIGCTIKSAAGHVLVNRIIEDGPIAKTGVLRPGITHTHTHTHSIHTAGKFHVRKTFMNKVEPLIKTLMGEKKVPILVRGPFYRC